MLKNYKILEVMAKALFGRVLLARDRRTKELVAIKCMEFTRIQAASTSEGIPVLEDSLMERHVNRVLSASAQHPSIVRMREDFEEDGVLHLVFDYCPHGDLFERVSNHNGLPAPLAQRYFRQIVSGVSHLHASGFAHRDLSLENILLSSSDDARICDFGLVADASSRKRDCVGKRFYIAPEVLEETLHDPKAADCWSLGVILFIMLTGVPIYDEPSEATDDRFQYLKVFGVRALLRQWGREGDIPDGAMDVLEKLLTITPSDRMNITELSQHNWVHALPCSVDRESLSKDVPSPEHVMVQKQVEGAESVASALSSSGIEQQPEIKRKKNFKDLLRHLRWWPSRKRDRRSSGNGRPVKKHTSEHESTTCTSSILLSPDDEEVVQDEGVYNKNDGQVKQQLSDTSPSKYKSDSSSNNSIPAIF